MTTTTTAKEARTPARRRPAAPGRAASNKRLDPVSRGILAAILIIITLLVLVPLWSILREAFSESGWRVIGRITEPTNLRIIGNTVLLGIVVGAAGTVLGFLLAFAQVRLEFRGKRLLHLLALLPVVSPPFALASASITLFGRGGVISNGLLGIQPDIYGLPGLSFILTMSFFPFSYMNFLGMMRHLDPSLDEASSNLGGNQWQTFWRVTLPMLRPGFAASFLLLFVEAIADLANPLVMGGNFTVLSTRAYIAINGEFNTGAASAYSLILLAPALLVFLVQQYWVSRKTVTTVTGKPAGRVRLNGAAPGRVPPLAFVYAVGALIIVLYGTVILGGFLKNLGVNNSFTWANYAYVFTGIGSDAILTTTTLAVIATPIASLLGMLVAWMVVRKLQRGSGLLDFLGMLGLAVPGTVLGIGYAVAYNKPIQIAGVQVLPALAGGLAVFGGAMGIVMVYITRSLPTSVRAGVSALHQISPEIDEASTSLGANSATTFRTITLPLIRAAMLTGLTYSFARSMTTLSPIIFITTPKTKIMTSQILGSVEAGRFGVAFAYCTVLIVIVMSVIGVMSALTSDRFYQVLARRRRGAGARSAHAPLGSPLGGGPSLPPGMGAG